MSPASPLPADVDRALLRGATVVTANQRAARTLRQAWNSAQRARGLPAWEPPAVFAWDTWLELLWHRLLLAGSHSALLLNPHQEHTLWTSVIARDPADASSGTLRPIDSLAALAARALRLAHDYRARPRLQALADTADARAFARWLADFERRATRDGLLPRARLAETLAGAAASGQLAAAGTQPRGLLLVGFDSRTPAQQALLDALATAGVDVDEPPPEAQAAARFLASCATPQGELELCAHWLRSTLETKRDARLAVIVPALAETRHIIDRTFRHNVAPELEAIAAPAHDAPWEFSLGVPLTRTGLVPAALSLLAWTRQPLALEQTSRLLLSPWFAAGAELTARAEFDAFGLRRERPVVPEFSVEQVYEMANRHYAAQLPVLLTSLRHLRAAIKEAGAGPAERAHSEWSTVFSDLLEAAGWSSAGPADSFDFQLQQRWQDALDHLSSLDFDGRRVTFPQALESLHRIAGETLFAPESRDAPVQVLGPLEAAGSQFDAVWFLGAGDLSWPAPASPHPLLSLRLQREAGMPGTDPAQEAALGRAIAARLAGSAPEVTFSFAREVKEAHQRPSPALAALGLTPRQPAAAAPPHAPVALVEFPEQDGLATPPEGVLRGGAEVLKLQAACGFRAFAEKRLFSSSIDSGQLGMDAMARGNVVHLILEQLWGELKTRAALEALTAAERRDLLLRCIDRCLASSRDDSSEWTRAYLAAERTRLERVLGNWLRMELDRPPFAVLESEREHKDVQIGPLRLNLRIDRIDTHLVDGAPCGYVLIDYKTGAAKPGDWSGDRPDEPQLPLYAVTAGRPLAGVAFSSIRPGKGMKLQGVSDRKELKFRKPSGGGGTLAGQVEEWRAVLVRLAEQFYAGEATVEPKQYPSTCRYCEQRLLCRLNPATLQPEHLEDLLDPDRENAEGGFA